MSSHMKTCPCPECERRRKDRQELTAVIIVIVLLAVSGLIWGCAVQPVVPTAVHSTLPSFDGGELNSGIIEAQPGGFVITPHFRDRYNDLVDLWGDQFAPAIKRDEGLRQLTNFTWFIDAQHMVQFIRMNTWRKSGRIKTTP